MIGGHSQVCFPVVCRLFNKRKCQNQERQGERQDDIEEETPRVWLDEQMRTNDGRDGTNTDCNLLQCQQRQSRNGSGTVGLHE